MASTASRTHLSRVSSLGALDEVKMGSLGSKRMTWSGSCSRNMTNRPMTSWGLQLLSLRCAAGSLSACTVLGLAGVWNRPGRVMFLLRLWMILCTSEGMALCSRSTICSREAEKILSVVKAMRSSNDCIQLGSLLSFESGSVNVKSPSFVSLIWNDCTFWSIDTLLPCILAPSRLNTASNLLLWALTTSNIKHTSLNKKTCLFLPSTNSDPFLTSFLCGA
mmetsp:Transcript_6130/g.24711  ORF Transcript_6130/g.24711 Transcript_6130/m.24711 type:complete len:220 (+) Transcript_6130:1836-2495(+)